MVIDIENLDHDAIDTLVRQLVAKLHEHIDVVHVSVSWNDSGKSYSLHCGAGNWYARRGLAQEFIEQDQSREVARELSKAINPPPPPDGEEWKSSVT